MNSCAYCKNPVSGEGLFCCQSCELLSTWQVSGVSPLSQKNELSSHWQKYNFAEIEAHFNISDCPVYKRFRIYIEGLQCSSCVHLLEDFPKYCGEVTQSRLNYAQHILDVEVRSTFGLGDLGQAIEDMGYKATPLKEVQDYEQAKQKETRQDLKRIGVAAAVAGNLMLFSVPIYAGLTGDLALVFKWLSFFIFLPLLFYSAQPFYKKAWASLLVRRLNVDMMIVVALWSGFLFSSYSLVLGLDSFYFDSTASFIFLILSTRYFLRKQQDRLLHKNIFSQLFVNQAYEVIEKNRTHFVAFDNLQSENLVKLNAHQLLPCDAILISDSAELDLAFLTGEAFPQVRHSGDLILAGSRLLSESAHVKISTLAEQSQLALSLNKIEQERKSKSPIQTFSDLISHRLTLAVFTVAALFFILTYPSLGVEAFTRCLALITIACPCAVAFGTPLAHSLGLKKSMQKGFYIRSENVFEKLATIKKVVFDKTGTLTGAELKLIRSFPENIQAEYRSLILGLEKSSMHPVALCLKKVWQNSEVQNMSSIKEIAGVGVEAQYNEHIYRLAKSEADLGDGAIQADFSVDGQRKAYLYFEENILPEARQVVNEFYRDNLSVMMLSGDKRARALNVAKQLEIRPAFVFSEQTPDSKKEFIIQNNPCLFVGDGLNDIPALNSAYVSFAVRGSIESTLQVCDIYAPQKNLLALVEIFKLSEKVQSTVKFNLLFAILYNSVGGVAALLGLINPLVAAILMPISSLLLVAHTVWRLQ